MRRYREDARAATSTWEQNWLVNHPVQGTAAALFKTAGNRLDRPFDAWLIVPMHDAFVFEAPLEWLREVAELTRRVMCDVVRECFPRLRPRAEVNIVHPGCWNKDGHSDSVDRWLEDPLYSL